MPANGHYLDSVNNKETGPNPNKFGSSSQGMGDNIFLTPILRYFPNQLTIQLPVEKKRFSILFEGLAEVEITNDINIIPDLGPCGEHYTTRKLRNYFGDYATILDNRPIILHSKIESEIWAAEYLLDKPNPVVFVPTCSPAWKEVRNIPVDLAQNIFQNLKAAGFTPIVCQSSANFLDIGEHQLNDLDLSKYISLLRQVGFYAGANTGDLHLAIGVGAKAVCYEPQSHSLFQTSEWRYFHPNITYYSWPVS